MQNTKQTFSNRTLKVTRSQSGSPPRDALFVGVVNGQKLYLTARDRSFHLLIIGGIGTGKTVTMEGFCRYDITSGNGLCLIDPMGALMERVLAFCSYRKAIGCRVPEVILFNASEGRQILPFNPFVRRDGELSVQVDRRVSATLRVWGQHSGDETPRLEKWLRIIFTGLIECNLSILEAGMLLDQHNHEVRALLSRGVTDQLIRAKLEQLSSYKPAEFLEQTESVENRLMRFLTSGHLRRIFGLGTNVLDFRKIMDEGKILLVNLQPSAYLSREQQRLIGTFLLNEFFETALTRPSGSRPFYCCVDEAAQFVTPELAEALEQCRQKGLHLTLAFQHLAQFREEGERVYKAFKNVRNKLVFAVPDRPDAQELADDLFVGLAEPELKFMHRRLNHLVEDIRQTSTTISHSLGQSSGRSRSVGTGVSQTSSDSRVQSLSRTASEARGSIQSRSLAKGRSTQRMQAQSHTTTESESHSWGYSDSTSELETTSSSRTASDATTTGDSKSKGTSVTASQEPSGEVLITVTGETEGRAMTQSRTHGQAETRGKAFTTGTSHTHSAQETVGSSTADTNSTGITTGDNTTNTFGRSHQRSNTQGISRNEGSQRGRSRGNSRTESTGENRERTSSESVARANQPGVRHTPFWEEDPEHWSLEEQRWRASELLMSQQIGHWFIRTSKTLGFGQTNLPQSFYMTPKQMLRLTRELYERHNLSPDQADELLTQRRAAFLNKVADQQTAPSHSPAVPQSPDDQHNAPAIWNRTVDFHRDSMQNPPAEERSKRKPGPKTDVESHNRVASIVEGYGDNWTTDDSLVEICEKLDEEKIPVPKSWPTSRLPARTWLRGLQNYRERLKKAISYACHEANARKPQATSKLSPTSAGQ